jgi:hypothetical protein
MRTTILVLVSLLGLSVSNCGSGIGTVIEKEQDGSIFAPRKRQKVAPPPSAQQDPQMAPINYSPDPINESTAAVPTVNPLPAPVYIPTPEETYAPSTLPSTVPNPLPTTIPTAITTLFVVISGNSTCHPARFRSTLPGLVRSSLFESFISTMMNTGYVSQNDNVIFACFETLSPQMQVYDMKLRPQMLSIHESQLDQIIVPQAQQAARIVVIGHSYGGWRSMKLLSSPQLQASVRAPIQLVTIDPISKVNCTNPLMPGCRQAPSDFTDVEFSILNTRTNWLNAVQEPGIILGSDTLPAAHVNLKFTGVNHFSIVNDTRLWQSITQFIPK